jgi:hypothetical protein
LQSSSAEFGDLPLIALNDPKVTKVFLRWRDGIAGRKQADYALTVLMLILAHGRKVGMTSYRPPGRIDKLYHADRSDKIGRITILRPSWRPLQSRCSGR